MERRIAVIDLGSNTCRLVVFSYTTDLAFRLVDQVSERLRIGEGMFVENRLQPEPMKRAVQLLKTFGELCEANRIDRIIGTATSAVREAVNGKEFLDRVERETGLRLRVLSGEGEAYYAYLGAINSLAMDEGIIADLGGGSLELVRVEGRVPVAWASLPLGAVLLKETLLHSDPIKPREVRELNDRIDAELDTVEWLRPDRNRRVVILGGTIRALAKADQKQRDYPLDRLHGYEMKRRSIRDITENLINSPLADRAKMRGIKGERADVIPAGAAVIFRLLKHVDVKQVTVSGQGLREGLFYEEFLTDAARQLDGPVRDVLIPAESCREARLPSGITAIPLIPDLQAFGVANLARLHGIDWHHAERVCELALSLFDQLGSLHGMGASERAVLGAAGILHDIGVVIDYYRHHLHSAYIIENADLPGYTQYELALLALTVRWHRRGSPSLEPFEDMLKARDSSTVRKLSVILRLAEDLERSRAQVVQNVRAHVRGNAVEVVALTCGAAGAELWSARRDADIFKAVFGLSLQLSEEPDKGGLQPAEKITSENIFLLARRLSKKWGALRPQPQPS